LRSLPADAHQKTGRTIVPEIVRTMALITVLAIVLTIGPAVEMAAAISALAGRIVR
jgi:hypothetical protein